MAFSTAPVSSAIIPSFLRFRISDVELSMGPVHGSYTELQRSFSASLKADPQQPVTSGPGFLEASEGRLHIEECSDLKSPWSGAICRRPSFTDPDTGLRYADYAVNLDVLPSDFDRFLAMVATGQELFALSLDFQNVEYPDEQPFIPDHRLWDDLRFPHVALTSFLLRWKPIGGDATPGYSWPAE